VSRPCGQTFPQQLPLWKLARLQMATYRPCQLRFIKELSEKKSDGPRFVSKLLSLTFQVFVLSKTVT
jgi:hypothetical protein